MTEHILSTLGLALRAGSVAVGEEPVGAAARAKKARVIFTAQDAAASSVRRANSFARAGSCLCLTVPADKDALGRALGRTSCAMCAVTDIGFAQSLVQKLADGKKIGLLVPMPDQIEQGYRFWGGSGVDGNGAVLISDDILHHDYRVPAFRNGVAGIQHDELLRL